MSVGNQQVARANRPIPNPVVSDWLGHNLPFYSS